MKHFDPTKSYRMFDGETVTGVERVYAGWTAKGTDGSVYHWYDSAPGSWPTEIKPTFEAGKSYRMKRGGTVRLERPIDKNGWTGLCDDGDRIVFYDVSGDDGLLPGAIEDEQPEPLINGEPQKVNITVTEADRMQAQINDLATVTDLRQIHSRLNRQAERLEFHEHDGLAKRLDALEKAAEAMPGPYAMGQLKDRINDLEGRTDALSSGFGNVIEKIPELETRCTNLGHKADGAHTRIGAVERELSKRLDDHQAVIGAVEQIARCAASATEELETALGGKANGGFAEGHRKRIEALERQMPAALGLTTKGAELRPATPVEQAINALRERLDHQSEAIDQLNQNADRRLNELENYTGLDVRSVQERKRQKIAELTAAVDRLAAIKPVYIPECECAYCSARRKQTPPKPTIKGGWVNVYWRDYGRQMSLGIVHQSKADADRTFASDHGDKRIACIQIPDITEGEGL